MGPGSVSGIQASTSQRATRRTSGPAPLALEADSGLILSWPVPYDHQMMLRCQQGMSFLALDARKWEKDVEDIVAPTIERQQIRPGLNIPAGGVGFIAPIPGHAQFEGEDHRLSEDEHAENGNGSAVPTMRTRPPMLMQLS